jgi:hypothetical protein
MAWGTAPRADRVPEQRARAARAEGSRPCRGKEFVRPEIMISELPGEAEDRAVPGTLGTRSDRRPGQFRDRTLVERTTRFTMLLNLPRIAEHGEHRVKNGPALADCVDQVCVRGPTLPADSLRSNSLRGKKRPELRVKRTVQ